MSDNTSTSAAADNTKTDAPTHEQVADKGKGKAPEPVVVDDEDDDSSDEDMGAVDVRAPPPDSH